MNVEQLRQHLDVEEQPNCLAVIIVLLILTGLLIGCCSFGLALLVRLTF